MRRLSQLLMSTSGVADAANDPVLRRVELLDLSFGGRRENPVYDVLGQIVSDYLGSDHPERGIRLDQNMALMLLTAETSSFRELHGFDVDSWRDHHESLCLQHLGYDRRAP